MYAAIRRLQEKRANGEEGFTLIELLVVIIIIGILAAIAIPVFLNQRKKGWDAAVQSDLRNAATSQETYFTDNSAYTGSLAALTAADIGLKLSGTGNYFGGVQNLTMTGTTGGYTMCAKSASGQNWSLTSNGSIAKAGSC